jgi:hypothetical protein
MPPTIEELDAQISALETQLMVLKHERNALVPICRLPAELLARVFLHLQAPIREQPWLWLVFNHEWAIATAACRHFREVALGAPELWTWLDSRHSPAYRAVAALRAGDVPLTVVDSKGVAGTYLSQARAAVIHLARNRELHGVGLLNLNARAPRLETLILEDESPRFTLTPAFLGGGSTSLVHLVLRCVLIEDPPPLPAVRRLDIQDISLRSLAELFRQTPGVEDLLVQCTRRMSRPAKDPFPAAPGILPRLRCLYIGGPATPAAALLELIPRPAETLAIQVVDTIPASWDDLAAQPMALAPHYARVYAAYHAFAATLRDPPPGTLIVRHDPARRGTDLGLCYRVAFGTPGGMGGPRLHWRAAAPFLAMNVHTLQGLDDMLARIGTLHLGAYPKPTNIDSDLGLEALRGVHTLVLDRWDSAMGSHAVQEWIARRCVRVVRFEGCHEELRALEQDLRQVVASVESSESSA